MSAFLVNDKNLSFIVDALFEAKENNLLDSRSLPFIEGKNRADFFVEVKSMNLQALYERYNDSYTQEELASGYVQKSFMNTEGIHYDYVLNTLERTLGMYLYQCCEGDVPEKVPLYSDLRMVQDDIVASTDKNKTIDSSGGWVSVEDLEDFFLATKLENELNNASREEKLAIANRDNLPEESMIKLIYDSDTELRKELRLVLANRSDLSLYIEDRLAEDESIEVKKILASKNINSNSAIRTLIADKSPEVRLLVAENQDFYLRYFFLSDLAEDRNKQVRKAIALKDNLPEDIVKTLADDKVAEVRETIKSKYSEEYPEIFGVEAAPIQEQVETPKEVVEKAPKQNTKKPFKTREEKQAEIKEITEQLEQGIKELFDSDKFKNYLKTMSKFHDYSFNNTLLIALQKPDASLVAGFNTWKKDFNRFVKKGEKGIRIYAPAPYKVIEEVEERDINGNLVYNPDGTVKTTEQEVIMQGFKVVSVFDVSQTDGDPIETLGNHELTSTVQGYEDFLQALTNISPVPISFEEIKGGAKGYFSPSLQKIVIQEGMSNAQTIKTLIHEIAHSYLHDPKERTIEGVENNETTRNTKEVQAESVAFTLANYFDIDTSEYSFEYIAAWSNGKELAELKESMDIIRIASSELITKTEKELQLIRENRTKVDSYEIWQYKDSRTLMSDYEFENYDRLTKSGKSINKALFNIVYSGELDGMSLDDLWVKFNIDHPADYRSHSLSVGDIIVLTKNGETTAHFVDSAGFRDVTNEFIAREETELAIKVGDCYISMFVNSSNEYEYSIYDKYYKLYDGGMVEITDDKTIRDCMDEVILDLEENNLFDVKNNHAWNIDPEELSIKVDKEAEKIFNPNKPFFFISPSERYDEALATNIYDVVEAFDTFEEMLNSGELNNPQLLDNFPCIGINYPDSDTYFTFVGQNYLQNLDLFEKLAPEFSKNEDVTELFKQMYAEAKSRDYIVRGSVPELLTKNNYYDSFRPNPLLVSEAIYGYETSNRIQQTLGHPVAEFELFNSLTPEQKNNIYLDLTEEEAFSFDEKEYYEEFFNRSQVSEDYTAFENRLVSVLWDKTYNKIARKLTSEEIESIYSDIAYRNNIPLMVSENAYSYEAKQDHIRERNIAYELVQFYKDYDYYEYMDNFVSEEQEALDIEKLADEIHEGSLGVAEIKYNLAYMLANDDLEDKNDRVKVRFLLNSLNELDKSRDPLLLKMNPNINQYGVNVGYQHKQEVIEMYQPQQASYNEGKLQYSLPFIKNAFGNDDRVEGIFKENNEMVIKISNDCSPKFYSNIVDEAIFFNKIDYPHFGIVIDEDRNEIRCAYYDLRLDYPTLDEMSKNYDKLRVDIDNVNLIPEPSNVELVVGKELTKAIEQEQAEQELEIIELKNVNIRLVDEPAFISSKRVTNPEEALDLLGNDLKSYNKEVVAALFMCNDRPVATSIVSMGSLNNSIIEPSELFKVALLSNANSFILLHNHPSGIIEASKEDKLVTKNLVEAGNIMNIRMTDHIIVAPQNEKYFSFRDHKIITEDLQFNENMVAEKNATRKGR